MDINIPGLLIINGLQGQGKSHLIRYIMYENRKKFDWGLVFTNTSFVGENYDYIPDGFVHSQYSGDALVTLKRLHSRIIKNGKKPSAFIIFDDCITGSQWRDQEFISAITQVRHYGFTILISTQYPQAIPSLFRSNIFQAVIFRLQGERALKALYECYGQRFDSYNLFKKFMMDNTGNYSFIFFDSRNNSEKLEDQYKIMKCPDKIPKFKLKFTEKI